jgi:hypothetical protein
MKIMVQVMVQAASVGDVLVNENNNIMKLNVNILGDGK